jgi:hypothetical protein
VGLYAPGRPASRHRAGTRPGVRLGLYRDSFQRSLIHEPSARQTDLLQAARKPFSDGHGVTTGEARDWEDGYRKRWQHDKIVRSTHGVNCTGSCSWKIYVKGGIITWETQQTDYPRTRPDLPNHEPRGCPRGASYSWYIYSAQRLKYPLIRKRLVKLWREARQEFAARRRVGLDPGGPCQAQELYRDPWAWRFRPFALGTR